MYLTSSPLTQRLAIDCLKMPVRLSGGTIDRGKFNFFRIYSSQLGGWAGISHRLR